MLRVVRILKTRGQQQRFGGSLTKNKHYEDWNGVREVSEKTFELKANSTVPQIFAYLVLPSIAIYTLFKAEMVRFDITNLPLRILRDE